MSGNIEHMLVSLKNHLLSAEKVPCGSTSISCLVVLGVRSNSYTVDSVGVNLPESVNKSVMVELPDGKWKVLPCNLKHRTDRVKLFLCTGVEQGPVGIRTSQDWDTTNWGIQMSQLPGVWLVACALPTRSAMEFKLVSGSDDNLTWEPYPYDNKIIDLHDEGQVIQANWGDKNVTKIDDIPVNKRLVTIAVTISDDEDTSRLLSSNPDVHLTMNNVKDVENSLIFPKGHKIQLVWFDCFNAYCAMLTVDGRLKKIRFSLSVEHVQKVVTHIDKHSFNKSGPRYREIDLTSHEAIHCTSFNDVRPNKWRNQDGVDGQGLAIGATSPGNLTRQVSGRIDTKVSPSKDHNTALHDDHSPKLKQRPSITRRISRTLSLKRMRSKILSKTTITESQPIDDEYTPKTHGDNAANVIGGGYASFLHIATSPKKDSK